MKRRILILSFILAFYLCFSPSYSDTIQAKKDQEALEHEVTVVLKLVQVYVTDKKGNPVMDLGKDDFILFDNGKLQKITDFEKHILALPKTKTEEIIEETKIAPQRKIPSRMNRKFFFLFDTARNDAYGMAMSRRAALYFIDTQLRPTDEVAVLSYQWPIGLTIHEYLTSDQKKIREIVKGIKELPGRSGQKWLMRLSVTSRSEKDSGFSPPKVDENKVKSDQFAEDIREFAKAIRSIPGYKNIIFFSGGFPRKMLGDKQFLIIYEDMSKELATSNSPVYTINTEGTRAYFNPSSERGNESLKMLSELSGGKYFESVDRYETISKGIQAITCNYYVLGYYIDENWDGKYHEIKVEVKRKGYLVHAQGGYFNPKPFSKLSEFEKQLHLIDLALSENPYYQTPLNFPLITLPCSSKSESNVVLLSEIKLNNLEDIVKQKTEIVILVLDEERNLVESSQGEISLSSLAHDRIYHYTILSLEPGQYECRVVIRNLKTGKSAVAKSSLNIPEPIDAGLQLYPPLLLIPEKESHYLKATKAQKEETGIEPKSLNSIYPFLSSKHSPLIEEFDQEKSKLLAVVRSSIFGIQEPDVSLSIYLIDQSSKQKLQLSFSILAAKSEGEIDMLLMEIQLPELKQGRYSLEITAEEMTTNSKSRTTQAFILK